MDLSKRGNNADWVHFRHLAVRLVFLNLAGLELIVIFQQNGGFYFKDEKKFLFTFTHLPTEK